MVKDLSFLEIKEGDSSELRSMKSYWRMVMDMPKVERVYFLQEERVKEEERYLQWMINCNNTDDELIADFTRRARSAVIDYEMFKDEKLLEIAEGYAEVAHSTKAQRFTIADIRKQREKIQWEKKKLSQMTKPSTEPSPYSSHSES